MFMRPQFLLRRSTAIQIPPLGWNEGDSGSTSSFAAVRAVAVTTKRLSVLASAAFICSIAKRIPAQLRGPWPNAKKA